MTIAPIDWLSRQSFERLVRDLGNEEPGVRRSALLDRQRMISSMVRTPPGAGGDDPHDEYHMALNISIMLAPMIEARRLTAGQGAAPEGTDLACAVRTFLAQGRQVFRFAPDLAEELAQTDVDDVSLSEVVFPYDAFLMEFDAQEHLRDGRAIESVLVERRGVALNPVLMLRPFVRNPEGEAEPLPMAMLPLSGGVENESVIQALDRAIDYYVGGPDMQTNSEDPEKNRLMIEEMSDLSSAHATTMIAGSGILEDILPLVVNGLLYVDNCRSGMRRVWDPAAPADLAGKADSDRPGARKAEQELKRLGWTRINLCALEGDAVSHEERGVQGARSPVRGHWRRGHWRRQPCGPGGTLRKRIRIRPMRIGGSGGGRTGYAVGEAA